MGRIEKGMGGYDGSDRSTGIDKLGRVGASWKKMTMGRSGFRF
jgi:hypothetical protein